MRDAEPISQPVMRVTYGVILRLTPYDLRMTARDPETRPWVVGGPGRFP